jgi:hypothetical protein
MAKDYIPESDEKFLDWAKNLYNHALSNYSHWQIPNSQPTIQPLLDNYKSAFGQARTRPRH